MLNLNFQEVVLPIQQRKLMSDKKKLIILTGINKGLGMALFNQLIHRKNFAIFGITRNLNQSQKALLKENLFDCYLHDFTKKIDSIPFKNFLGTYNEIIFINNAFTIEPINHYKDITKKKLQDSISINILTPLFIVNDLVKSLNSDQNLKIINISSGASINPIKGWSMYCSSKSFIEMFFKCLDLEDNIETHSIDPGVLDTDMQLIIRSNSDKDFDWVKYFNSIELKNPNEVAKSIVKNYL